MALQFMLDVSFVMGSLVLRTGPGKKKEGESDQLLNLAVMSKVLTAKYILPQWALTSSPVYA